MSAPAIRRVLAAALLAAPGALAAQVPAPAPADTQLTLGQAARLAAARSAPAQVAQLRTRQAEARVTQRRADLLPSLTGAASDNTR
ncbi:MAG: hypothetical protein ACXW0Z_14405, partial [Gemmatirosa sp.]